MNIVLKVNLNKSIHVKLIQIKYNFNEYLKYLITIFKIKFKIFNYALFETLSNIIIKNKNVIY